MNTLEQQATPAQMITVRGQQYTVIQARDLAAELRAAVRQATLASPATLQAIADDAKELHGVELWEVAGVAGVDLDNASNADATKMAMTVIYWPERAAEHVLACLDRALNDA